MNSFWRIFWLEWTEIVRSKTLALLTLAAVAWMFVAPHLFRTDGTLDGARELAVHYSLGGVAALLCVALLAAAAGSISKERAAKRLQLTLVRPVRRFEIALGKMLAQIALGALVMGIAAAIEYCRLDDPSPCRRVFRPVLISPAEEAEILYPGYMADPETPEAAKKAPKATILRILTQRACDRYQTVNTNEVAKWKFAVPESCAGRPTAVSFRLTNMYDMREEIRGELRFNDLAGQVSSFTRTVVESPLAVTNSVAAEPSVLEFHNLGDKAVMLRPRKDIEILVEADGFGMNLVRAWLELVAMMSLLIAFGTFLGSALSRPVALFTAMVVLLLGEMTPSVVQQYPDELESDRVDRLGLAVTRFMADFTHPFSAFSPLAKLSARECVEPVEVARALAQDLVCLPLLLAALSALVMRRKVDD